MQGGDPVQRGKFTEKRKKKTDSKRCYHLCIGLKGVLEEWVYLYCCQKSICSLVLLKVLDLDCEWGRSVVPWNDLKSDFPRSFPFPACRAWGWSGCFYISLFLSYLKKNKNKACRLFPLQSQRSGTYFKSFIGSRKPYFPFGNGFPHFPPFSAGAPHKVLSASYGAPPIQDQGGYFYAVPGGSCSERR